MPQSIHLSPVTSPDFAEAELALDPSGLQITDSGVRFNFMVSNYELTAQTPDVATKNCANSADGQHIHLILNNEPYLARYQSSFTEQLDTGNYVLLAFLSRSYHESLKHPGAYLLRSFRVPGAQTGTKSSPGDRNSGTAKNDGPKSTWTRINGLDFDPMAPHLFYSRPKGTYSGADTSKILLDFYLVNAQLSPDGYRVKAQIDTSVFWLDRWEPKFIEGLGVGSHTVELTLVNNEGQVVPSPFNPVTRTINLTK